MSEEEEQQWQQEEMKDPFTYFIMSRSSFIYTRLRYTLHSIPLHSMPFSLGTEASQLKRRKDNSSGAGAGGEWGGSEWNIYKVQPKTLMMWQNKFNERGRPIQEDILCQVYWSSLFFFF